MRMINRSLFALALSLFCFADFSQTAFAQTEYVIVPSKTYFDTDRFRPKYKAKHLAYINSAATPQNRLLVHFVGSGGKPESSKEWLKYAASLGYHVVSIAYINDDSIASLCINSDDADCYEKTRLEVIDGIDRSPLVFVRRADSIEFRLIKLLEYLQQQNPSQNWAQFLDTNNSPVWAKTVLSGHSQGGGHAALMAKTRNVARVVQFASTADFSNFFNAPATWLAKSSVTPTTRYFGFGHQRDQAVSAARLLQNWTALGMNASGAVVNVDVSPAPYQNTQRLSTNLEPRIAGEYHGGMIVDVFIPRDANRQIVYLPVWNYLLNIPTQ